MHSALTPLLADCPKAGRLFPGLSVNTVTKRFAVLRERAGINRQGVVFHSTRKWFVTQCERAGVPEHFTASIVGNQSARSATLLRSKLVVCEEVNLRPGSGDANTLKTYITEKFTAGEAKGKETEWVEQRVCLVLTSNHMPFWIELEDRRYYIVNVDHEGYARGPQAEAFAALVGRLEEWSEDPANIARLYNALMARPLPDDFSAKTLNVDAHGTEIMRQVFGNGRATILDQLKEHLDAKQQYAIAETDVVEVVTGKLKANINTTKHLMSDLGWTKSAVKWGGIDYARALWVRPGYLVERGKIFGPDGFEEALGQHLNDEVEVIR